MSESNSLEKFTPKSDATGRRRFVRGVGVALPLALTVSAKSAMACHCTSVSANSSIKLANSHNATGDVNNTVDCNGKFPSFWAANPPPNNPLFKTIFGGTGNKTMSQKAALGDTDKSAIFAAAYLNSVSGRVHVRYYTVAHLQAMWPVVKNGGVYEPVAGALWTGPEILAYLSATFG